MSYREAVLNRRKLVLIRRETTFKNSLKRGGSTLIKFYREGVQQRSGSKEKL
jgi:hypothetical protein